MNPTIIRHYYQHIQQITTAKMTIFEQIFVVFYILVTLNLQGQKLEIRKKPRISSGLFITIQES